MTRSPSSNPHHIAGSLLWRLKWFNSAQINWLIKIFPISGLVRLLTCVRIVLKHRSVVWAVEMFQFTSEQLHPAVTIPVHIINKALWVSRTGSCSCPWHRVSQMRWHPCLTQSASLACLLYTVVCSTLLQTDATHHKPFLQMVQCSNPMSNTVTTYCTHRPILSKLGERVPYVPHICSSALWVLRRKPFIVTQRCIFLVALKPWH